MLPTKPGTYIGFARSHAVEQREGKCPRWIAEFQLGQCFNGTEWEPVAGDVSITAYLTLINTNGQPNEINCQSIVDAYELPKFDFKTLETHDFSGTEIQVVIDFLDFIKDGITKRVLDVKYLNHRNYERKSLASDPVVVQSLDAKYGNLLRMKFKPKTPVTSNGAAHKPVITAAPVADPTEAAKRNAWNEFKSKTPAMEVADRNKKWTETVQGYAGKPVTDLSVADWQAVASQIVEFGPWQAPAAAPVAAGVSDDDLPF